MEQELTAAEILELEVMMHIEPFGDARLDRLFAFGLRVACGIKESSVADFEYPWPWPASDRGLPPPSVGGFTHPDLIAEFGVSSP